MFSKKIILIILGVIIVILITLGAYSFGKYQSESEKVSGKVSDSKSDSNKKSDTTKPPAETSGCSAKLTGEEKETINSWKIYTSSEDGYTFKHPGGWNDVDEQFNSVIMTNDAALYSFQFGVLDEPSGGLTELSREAVVVACENTQKVSLTGLPPGGENFRRVITQFTKNGKKYSAVLAFRHVDESTSNGLKEQYNLILKTIDFN